jgi:hypothetical protein
MYDIRRKTWGDKHLDPRGLPALAGRGSAVLHELKVKNLQSSDFAF